LMFATVYPSMECIMINYWDGFEDWSLMETEQEQEALVIWACQNCILSIVGNARQKESKEKLERKARKKS